MMFQQQEYNYPIKIRSTILEQDHEYFYDLTKNKYTTFKISSNCFLTI